MKDKTLIETAKNAGLFGIHQARNFDGQRPYWCLEFSDDGNAEARKEIESIHHNEVATRLLRLQLVEESEHPSAEEWREYRDYILKRMERPMMNFQLSALYGELHNHSDNTETLQSYSVTYLAKEGASA